MSFVLTAERPPTFGAGYLRRDPLDTWATGRCQHTHRDARACCCTFSGSCAVLYLFRVGEEVGLDVLPLVEDVLVHGPSAEREGVAVVRHSPVNQPQLLQLTALRLRQQEPEGGGRGGCPHIFALFPR